VNGTLMLNAVAVLLATATATMHLEDGEEGKLQVS
jgi:hypothetical protein